MDQKHQGAVGRLYERLAKRFIEMLANRFVACGADASEYLFPGREGVLILANSIDVDEFATARERGTGDFAESYGLGSNCVKLVQIGRLQPVKNHQFTLDLARELTKSGVDFALFIVGVGPLHDAIYTRVQELGIADRVFMLGGRSDIPQIMAKVDLVLMPSLHEGFPVVLVESQSSGVRALVSDSISREVDLGVGLVDFLPLSASLDTWIQALTLPKSTHRLTTAERIEILKKRGFDSLANVVTLERLYANF